MIEILSSSTEPLVGVPEVSLSNFTKIFMNSGGAQKVSERVIKLLLLSTALTFGLRLRYALRARQVDEGDGR